MRQKDFNILLQRILKNTYYDWPRQQFSYKKLDPNQIKQIFTALKQNKEITDIDLQYCSIDNEGAKIIAGTLKYTEIISITLSNNNINDEGAKALAEALKDNTTITFIDLTNNYIKDEGAKALAEALQKNTRIQFLQLWENQYTDVGQKAINEALKKHPCMIELFMVRDNEVFHVFNFNRIRKYREYAERIITISDKKYEDLTIADKAFIINTIINVSKFSYLQASHLMTNDPTGRIQNRELYTNEAILDIQTKFNVFKTELDKDIKFMSNYYVTLFEQKLDMQYFHLVLDKNFTQGNAPFKMLRIKEMGYEISTYTATSINPAKIINGQKKLDILVHTTPHKQKLYTKNLTKSNQHVKILKDVGIIAEADNDDYHFIFDMSVCILKNMGIIVENTSNTIVKFIIDINQDKLDKLTEHNIDKDVLSKVLKQYGASRIQVFKALNALPDPTTEVNGAIVERVIKKIKTFV